MTENDSCINQERNESFGKIGAELKRFVRRWRLVGVGGVRGRFGNTDRIGAGRTRGGVRTRTLQQCKKAKDAREHVEQKKQTAGERVDQVDQRTTRLR